MKAYNSPTDELHIKSNSGEELVKITPNETKIKNMDLSSLGIESTPEEIDEAVAKGGALPEITNEDEGKGLLVENGKFVLSDRVKNKVLGLQFVGAQGFAHFSGILAQDEGSLPYYYYIPYQATFTLDKYYHKRNADGTYSDEKCALSGVSKIADENGGIVIGIDRYDPTVDAIIELSAQELQSLLANGTLTIPTPNEGEFVIANSETNVRVCLNGFYLENITAPKEYSALVYSSLFATFGITKPCFITCAYSTASITITFEQVG